MERSDSASLASISDTLRMSHNVPSPISWSFDDCLHFIRSVVRGIMGRSIGDEDDFFDSGMDSRQAARVQNIVLQSLKHARVDVIRLKHGIIYSHPNIGSLALCISDLALGLYSYGASSAEADVERMEALLDKFSKGFWTHSGSQPLPARETVLVTGTMSGLGGLVLSRLVSLPSVERVYTLNKPERSNSRCPRELQLAVFSAQGIGMSILDSPKLVLLEGDATVPGLDLSSTQFMELRNSLTSIFHLAWADDFKLSLSSFVPDLRGVRNIIDLALSSPYRRPPTIVFPSSTADVQNCKGFKNIPESVTLDPHDALGSGFGEAKWVASMVLEVARATTALQPVIARLGLLCGNSTTGRWDEHEWFPSMVHAGGELGCLPFTDASVSWLPVDLAASVLVDVRLAGPTTPFVNVAHPRPTPWKSIISPIAEWFRVPLVSYTEWLRRLESAGREGRISFEVMDNLLSRLNVSGSHRISISDAGYGRQRPLEADIAASIDLQEALGASETLSSLTFRTLDERDVRKWMRAWKIGSSSKL